MNDNSIVILKCRACLKETYYLSEGFCLDCAYKKLQMDMAKNVSINSDFGVVGGQAWICPKCGAIHGPSSQRCWCSGNTITCNSLKHANCCQSHQVTQDMFVPVRMSNELSKIFKAIDES